LTQKLLLPLATTAYFSFQRVLGYWHRKHDVFHQAVTDSSWQKDTAALQYNCYTQLQVRVTVSQTTKFCVPTHGHGGIHEPDVCLLPRCIQTYT